MSSDSALCFRQSKFSVLVCFGVLISLAQQIESVRWVELSVVENESGSQPVQFVISLVMMLPTDENCSGGVFCRVEELGTAD